MTVIDCLFKYSDRTSKQSLISFSKLGGLSWQISCNSMFQTVMELSVT